MNISKENKPQVSKISGIISLLIGIYSFYKGEACLTYYGYTTGTMAKIAGVLMVVMGLSIIFSKNKK